MRTALHASPCNPACHVGRVSGSHLRAVKTTAATPPTASDPLRTSCGRISANRKNGDKVSKQIALIPPRLPSLDRKYSPGAPWYLSNFSSVLVIQIFQPQPHLPPTHILLSSRPLIAAPASKTMLVNTNKATYHVSCSSLQIFSL